MADDFEDQGLNIVAVHEALDRLAELNERQSQVMTLRYFGGLTVPEVAVALGVSVATVEKDWRLGAGLAQRPACRERRVTRKTFGRPLVRFVAVARSARYFRKRPFSAR